MAFLATCTIHLATTGHSDEPPPKHDAFDCGPSNWFFRLFFLHFTDHASLFITGRQINAHVI